MDQHRNKECRIEVRNDGCATDAETPCEALDPVGGIVGLAGVGPPAARQKAVARLVIV